MRYLKTFAVSASLAAIAMSTSATAQEAVADQDSSQGVGAPTEATSATGLQDIVVTAQRRSENLQRVPVAVTAASQAQLTTAGITNSLSVGRLVPSTKIKEFGGRPNVFIRGVGLNDFSFNSVSPIAMYRDDAVITNAGSQNFPLFDLAQVQVLRGPQGTLFGKNTTGGAILFTSKLPDDEFEGNGSLDYGRYNLVRIQGGVTVPLADGLTSRISTFVEKRDGDNRNIFTGDRVGQLDRTSVRGIIRYHPDTSLDAVLTAGYNRDKGDYRMAKNVGLLPGGVDASGFADPQPNNPHILSYNYQEPKNVEDKYAIFNLGYKFGPFGVKSITAYDHSDAKIPCDCDGGPATLAYHRIGPVTAKEFSQELQLTYTGGGHEALLGLYYDNSKSRDFSVIGLSPSFFVGYDIFVHTKSYAIFGQDAWSITDRLTLTGGLRYTWDKYDGTHRADIVTGVDTPTEQPVGPFLPPVAGNAKFSYLSWRATLNYRLFPEVNIYASANRGQKAGLFGFNKVFDPNARNLVSPEKLTSFEAGIKTTLFDRHLRLNGSVFHYKYDNLQVVSVSTQVAGGLPITQLQNAAKANISGVELEASASLFDHLTLSSNFGFLSAKYKSFPNGAIDPSDGSIVSYSNNRLPNAPKFTNSSSIDYDPPISNELKAQLHVDYAYTSLQYYNSAEDKAISSRKGYGLVNARVGIAEADDRWSASVWVQNLTNKKYVYEVTDSSFAGIRNDFYGELRTYGLTLAYKF